MYPTKVTQLIAKRTVKVCGFPSDDAGDDAAERHAYVHPESLQGIRRRATHRGSQTCEERRLRRPERAAADAPQRVDRECVPRRPDQRHERERERHHRERSEQHALRADPVGERPAEEAARERRHRLDRSSEAGETERDPTHVVEIDEQEREDDAVPERVDERPELEHVDGPRQPWVEAAEIGAHPARG
jgi:hypothetical protein